MSIWLYIVYVYITLETFFTCLSKYLENGLLFATSTLKTVFPLIYCNLKKYLSPSFLFWLTYIGLKVDSLVIIYISILSTIQIYIYIGPKAQAFPPQHHFFTFFHRV